MQENLLIAVDKITQTIDSCLTLNQLEVTYRMIENFSKTFKALPESSSIWEDYLLNHYQSKKQSLL